MAGKITYISKNYSEAAEGIGWHAKGNIDLQAGTSVKMYGAQNGVQLKKNDPAALKQTAVLLVTKIEGPFDDKGNKVAQPLYSRKYWFRATFNRKASINEIKNLKWAKKLKGSEDKQPFSVNYDTINSVSQTVAVHTSCLEMKLYAYFVKPIDPVSLAVSPNDTIKIDRKLIGKAKRDPGFNFDGTPAEDMQYADKPAKSASIMKDDRFSESDELLAAWMGQLIESTSMFRMETVALAMKDRFCKGTGGTFKSEDLNKEIKTNKAYLDYHKSFQAQLEKQLKTVDYDPTNMELISMSLLNFSSFMDKVTGLGITIHQVWSVKAELKDYTYNIRTGKWSGELIYTFYDHFGLDWEDIVKHGNDRFPQYHTGDCFKAWYILQHYRSAKPFITEIEEKQTVGGRSN